MEYMVFQGPKSKNLGPFIPFLPSFILYLKNLKLPFPFLSISSYLPFK